MLDGLADLIGDLGPTLVAEAVSGPGGSGMDGTPTGQDRTVGPPSSGPPVGAPLPTADDLIDATLRLVVALARVTVPAADGVSVSLRRSGHLATVAASDQTVLDMDAEQYATGEGPCVDASREGVGFHAMSLDAEVRWPAFTPLASGVRHRLHPVLAVGRLRVGRSGPSTSTRTDRWPSPRRTSAWP